MFCQCRYKLIILVSVFLSTFVIAFFIGYYNGIKGIVVHNTAKDIDVYPIDKPLYNLPIAELYSIWIALERDQFDLAKKRTISHLQGIEYDARIRASYCPIAIKLQLLSLSTDIRLLINEVTSSSGLKTHRWENGR